MRIYNRLIAYVAVAFLAIDVFLAFAGQRDISVYFIANAIAYLLITLLFAYLNPRARRSLSALNAVIFAGFLVVVAIKVIEILK